MAPRSNRRLRLLVAACAVISGLFIYPLVHELGHLLVARWFGADVGEFIWTPILGNPHVSLSNVPADAMPWVDASGVLLPTILGAIMIIVWIVWLHRLRLCFVLVLMPGAVLLLANLGLVSETFRSAGYHHMRGLARAWLGEGSASIAVEIAPALVSAILIAGAVWRIASMRRAHR